MGAKKMKTTSLDKLIDKHIGKKGSKNRNDFEEELRLDVLGIKIKELRESKNLTQVYILIQMVPPILIEIVPVIPVQMVPKCAS